MKKSTVATLDRVAITVCGWAADAMDIVVPVCCAVCESPGATLCAGCRLLLRRSTVRAVRMEPPPALASSGVPVWAAGRYEHELASCLLAYKNGGRTDLAGVLGTTLTPVLHRAAHEIPSHGGPLLWVPVPTSSRALRKRWFDPVAEMLRRATLPVGTKVHPGLENHQRWWSPTPSQKVLDLAHRARAVRGTMRAAHVRGITCVVVDDVLTTGATAAEAIRVLRKAGAQVRGTVVLATVRAPPLTDDSSHPGSSGSSDFPHPLI